MFVLFLFFSFVFVHVADSSVAFPPWIADNPAFQRPTEVNSVEVGFGSISGRGTKCLAWLVRLNDKTGHGIEIKLAKLSVDPDSEDFLMLAPLPLSSTVQVKLFSGTFLKPTKPLRIPNTKSVQVLFCASKISSEVALTYRRYGSSLEEPPPSTDRPVKKETVHEVQLRGKHPNEYADLQFVLRFKQAVRSAAQRYSAAHKIPFNDSIPTQEMVLLHRVSFCPFEWPHRDVCASVEHSVHVSGVRVSGEELIRNYELSAEHLKSMWKEEEFPELEELGVSLFLLPRTSYTVSFWLLIVGFMAAFSLMGSFFFWKNDRTEELRLGDASPGPGEVKKEKKTKLKLGKQQRIPSFMCGDGSLEEAKEKVLRKEKYEDVIKTDDSGQLPIKSYFGSILFGSNRAFEEDEDSSIELQTKTTSM